jgi:ABC-type dipeptide/oligopeptide/nickel transport system permease component
MTYLLLMRRIVGLIFVVFSITFITFIVGHLAPGDPIRLMMGNRQDEAQYQRLRHRYGLDAPLLEQYARYTGDLLQGNLGLSYRYPERPVTDLIRNGIPVSLGLGLVALILSLLLGIPLGIMAALHNHAAIDRISTALVLLLYSVPGFVLIPILRAINYVSYTHGGPTLPAGGWGTPNHWIMPVIVLTASSLGYVMRLTRFSMLEVLQQDYIRTAKGKGLTQRAVFGIHAFRNALLPLLTVIGPSVAFLVTGTFVVETIFSIPGIGYLSVQAIQQRDYPVIQSTAVILAVAVVLMNLLTDIAYMIADPRVRVNA